MVTRDESIADRVARAQQEAEQAQALASRYGLEYVDVARFRIDNDLLRSIPFDLMLRYHFIPEGRHEGRLAVVLADPTDVVKLDELEMLLGEPVEPKVGARTAIEEILQKSESVQRVLDEASEDFRMQLVQEDEQGEEVLVLDRLTADQSPIIKLVDTTIFNAIQRRASDIHIETRDSEVIVKYRIDGVLYQAMEPIDKRHHQTIISRLKVMSELDIAEKRVPQDGRFKLRLTQRTIDFRVSILPTVHGEDCVIRILDKESMSKDFKNLKLDILGFDDDTMRKLRKFIREPYGMVLVTGPTGSGKTTTLYACLSEIQSSEDKIITIEDPVEYQLRGISQIPVNEKKGLTFARGLRSILRHDPDKVMVGEIRDEETAQIAIQSALTGHLVFTTVHANNVVDVLGRFLNMKVDLYNFVSALNCVLAQRLVRKICPHCKRAVKAPRKLLEDSGLDPGMYGEQTFYEGGGCIECDGTGFHGRLAVSELLDLSDTIRELILAKRPGSEIKRVAKEEGMVFLRESALQKVFEGVTTLARGQQGDLRRMSPPLAAVGKRLLGLGAVAAPPHVFALDATTLRYGRFVEADSTWELRELRRAELGADAFQPGVLGGPLREPAAFGERLRQLLALVSAPVREASLVLPDAWLRLTFIESLELPRAAEARDEIVRWKVKRLLPFRVEDLRLVAEPVPAAAAAERAQAAARRLRARGVARAARGGVRSGAASGSGASPARAWRWCRRSASRSQERSSARLPWSGAVATLCSSPAGASRSSTATKPSTSPFPQHRPQEFPRPWSATCG